jgi:hypothetical protein
VDFSLVNYFHARCSRAREHESRDQGISEHGQVWSIHVRKSIRAEDRKPLPISDSHIGKSAAALAFHHGTVRTVKDWNANGAYTRKRCRDHRVGPRPGLDKEETTGPTALWIWNTMPVLDPPIDLQYRFVIPG